MASAAQLASLPSPPAGLAPWARVLWYAKDTIVAGVTYLLYEYGQEIEPVPMDGSAGAADEWRRFVCHFENNQSGELADDMQFSIDVVNYTNGAIDSTWTDADYQSCCTNIRAFVTTVLPMITSRTVLTRISAYRMAFNPYSVVDKPFTESGPPQWIDTPNLAGTGGPNSIPQAASTITERTPSRAHWGRIYLPSLSTTALTVGGRLTSGWVTGSANAYSTLMGNMNGSGFTLVVPTTSVNKIPTRTLQAVSAVSVDDVPDAHHRRRYKTATVKHIIPATAGTLPAP